MYSVQEGAPRREARMKGGSHAKSKKTALDSGYHLCGGYPGDGVRPGSYHDRTVNGSGGAFSRFSYLYVVFWINMCYTMTLL